MDLEILHQVDAPESSAQAAKRRRTTSQTARAEEISLPSGFPQPPAGFEDRFHGWARRWIEMHPQEAASGELSMALAKLEQLVTSTAGNRGTAILEVAQKRCQAAQGWLDKLTTATNKVIGTKVEALEDAMSGDSWNLDLVNKELKSLRKDMKKAQAELKDAWAEVGGICAERERIRAEITVAANKVDEILSPRTHGLEGGSEYAGTSCAALARPPSEGNDGEGNDGDDQDENNKGSSKDDNNRGGKTFKTFYQCHFENAPLLTKHGGLHHNGKLYLALSFEYVDDHLAADPTNPAHSPAPRALSKELKKQVMDALAKLHELGIAHGNPHRDNVLFASELHGKHKLIPKFIGFSSCIIDATNEELEKDLKDWRKVLYGASGK
ncbi:hypothetical protein GQ54DRAFT_335046 [Martensiomyces pterosporus]|nr:hypothetical protein GQ54DRAFT_335046 [Martensiomyces pterosporus]